MVNQTDSLGQTWQVFVRIVIPLYLFLSAFMAVCYALAVEYLVPGENAKILQLVLLLFAGTAIAFARAVRKLDEPSWKHWLIVAFLAAPAVFYTFFR